MMERNIFPDAMDANTVSLFSLSLLLRRARAAANVAVHKSICQTVCLSDSAKLLIDEVRKLVPEASDADIYLSFFADLFHHDLWVDPERTDQAKLKEYVDNLFFTRALCVPWMFGRKLYDDFFEKIGGPRDELTPEETTTLLDGGPTGIAQVGDYIVGPFGLVQSATNRRIFPTRNLPLWHCADTGCTNLHEVELNYKTIADPEIIAAIQILAGEKLGEPKDLFDAFTRELDYRKNFYNNSSVVDIAALLVSALNLPQLRVLLAKILQEKSALVRAAVKHRGIYKELFKGPPEVIAGKLDTPECLQLILIANDQDIIVSLEELIFARRILIPPTEVRVAILGGQGPGGWLGYYSELGYLGIRRVSRRLPDIHLAYAAMRRMILDFYEKRGGSSTALAHLLRFSDGESLSQKLDSYLSQKDPRVILRETVSIHENGLKECLQSFFHSHVPSMTCEEDERYVIDKILWKLGFSLQAHSDTHQVFDARLNSLLDSVLGVAYISEADREKTRSAAVNFFVSLEEILDLTLSYSSWVFLSDHYAHSKFRFEIGDGRMVAAEHLDGVRVGKDKLQIRSDGRNTLYPLIEGINQLGILLRKMVAKSYKKHERGMAERPGYAGQTPYEEFPFNHTHFVFDANPADRERCFSALQEAARILTAANVCDVRNRLEHKRKDFPSKDEVEVCCKEISTAMKLLLDTGLCPMDYYKEEEIVDAYSRPRERYLSSTGGSVVIYPLQYPLFSFTPPAGGPVNFIPRLRVGNSAASFYSYIDYSSEYDVMWRNFPRRKLLDNQDEE